MQQEIFLYGPVEASSAKPFIDALNSIKGPVIVRINSPGGDVFAGLAMYNALAARKNSIVKIDGLAASIASLIAMAGARVEMASNALMMIHNPWSGGTVGDAAEHRRQADLLDKAGKAMTAAYVQKSGKSETEIAAIMAAETWLDAEESLAAGFIDTIFEPLRMAASYIGLDTFTNLPPRFKTMINSQGTVMPSKPAVQKPAPAATIDAATQAKLDRLTALEQENTRQGQIKADFQKFMAHAGVSNLLNACLADPEISAAAAGKMLLMKLAEGAAPIAGGYVAGEPRHHVVIGENAHHHEYFAAATDYLLMKSGIRLTAPHPAAVDLRGMSLTDIAGTMLSQAGGAVKRRMFGGAAKPMDIWGAAMTTSDLPLLLENVASKALQNGYDNEPSSHRIWTKQSDVPDFKPVKRVAVSEAPGLDLIPELGEYRHGSLTEKGTGFQLETFGKILSLSRQAIINDDLDALTKIPQSLGRSASRLEADKVYAILTGNPAMADSIALFHESHGNLPIAAALSQYSLAAARTAMRTQKGMQGAILNIVPRYLIVPAALESDAEQLIASLVDPSKNNQTPQYSWIRGLVLVVDARLDEDSETAWYLAADYNQVDTVEIAYLQGEGERGAFIDQETGFDVDAVKIKCRLDFAAAAIDWIGMVKNAGG